MSMHGRGDQLPESRTRTGASRHAPSTPMRKHMFQIGSSSTSVVMCVMSAKFFTSPHASPSGVSLGHNMPHCDGCSARGPETLRVFSNWDEMRVIMPRAEMNERRDRTWVMPARSILKRFSDQLPVEIARTNPCVIPSPCSWNCFSASNSVARFAFRRILSMLSFRSWLNFLNRSSNRSDRS